VQDVVDVLPDGVALKFVKMDKKRDGYGGTG
jgi:hypothetical protein